MSDSSAAASRFEGPALATRRALAFRTAQRHSVHVRILRRLTIGGVVIGIGAIVAITVFNPFGRSISGLGIDGATIDGTKVTMTNPKLSGFEKDGRPYAIEAARAVQDIKTPTLFELHQLKARLSMADRSETRLTAELGNYNSAAETMTLPAGAHVVGDSGLDVVTQDAVVTFKTNALTTERPVTVSMPGKRIVADAMSIVDGGRHVTFEGHVRTDLMPEQGSAPTETANAPFAQ